MFIEVFLKGIAAGLLIAAPVGPVGVLCVHRTLVWGRLHGLLSGFGAAVADALFAVVAAFGLSFISDFMIEHQHWLRLSGGCLLLILGIKNLISKPAAPDEAEPRRSLIGDCASAFALTSTNPITIISFLGVFAALGVARHIGRLEANALVLGVFSGSALWWIVLSSGVGFMRRTIETLYMRWVHVISGALMLVFGTGALAGLLW